MQPRQRVPDLRQVHHRRQLPDRTRAALDKLSELIAQRQAAFRARTGEEMTGSNVWLEQRLTEQRALETIIAVLKQPELTEHPDPAVRGPGTTARAANQPPADQSRYGAREPGELARRRAAQTPSRNRASPDRARRAHHRRRTDHLPRPRDGGGRVDR